MTNSDKVYRVGICPVCGKFGPLTRLFTCSDACHDKLVDNLVAEFGEFKKVVRVTTGEAFKVPTRDILERGIRERDLDQYPKWDDK